MDAVTFSGVVRDFGEVRALDHLDLALESGRITTVLGPNGAGKTTAIDVMLGLRRPTSGNVRVLGARPGHPSVRSRIGAMLQEPGFPEAVTGAELLGLVAAACPDPLPVDRVLDHADLDGLGDRRIAQLSGGQRQRVAFGMALVGNPDLLFLDEPTVALDVQARQRFWDRIRDLADRGHTVVFTTHHLAEAEAVADRVIVIDHGRVLADGTPSKIRSLVAGRTINLTTDLPTSRLAGLPGVEHVDEPPAEVMATPSVTGRPVTLHVQDPEAVLATLLRDGHRLTDLTVAEATLEQAFVHLTQAA